MKIFCRPAPHACKGSTGPSTKTLPVVRSAIIIFLALATFHAKAAPDFQTITYSAKGVTLQKIFSVFKEQTGYLFFYRKEELDSIKPLSVKLKNATLESALETVLSNLPLGFEIQGNTVFIRKVNRKQAEPALEQSAPAIITGIITNEEQSPLVGASVKIKGTSTGTTSDVDGRFSLDANPGQTLLVSYVGYLDQQIVVNRETSLIVKLSISNSEMNKVVVVGYGSQNRKDVSGAVASVKPSATANTPVNNLTQMLQGQTAGVSVTSNSGAPGAGLTVKIRGINSFGSNQPLYVVDGIPLGDDFNLSAINTSDIESIDILKDASATAIYGTRAANGVVQITTKRGKSGRPTTSFSAYYGWQSLQKKVDVLNAQQFGDYVKEVFKTDTVKPILDQIGKVNTDWQDEVFNSAARIQNYNLTTTGGNDNTQFAINGGYFNQEGIIRTSGFKRYSARVNVSTKATKWLKLSTNLNFSRSENDLIVTDNIYTSPSILALKNQPTTLPTKIGVGKWNGSMGGITGDAFQPLAILNEEKRHAMMNMFFGNVLAEATLMKGLMFSFNFSENYSYNSTYAWIPHYEAGVNGNFGTGQKGEADNYYSNTSFYSTLAYSRSIQRHQFTVMLGTSAEKIRERFFNGGTDGFLYNDLQDLTRGDLASNIRYVNGATSQGALASYFGRLNYSYDGKYLLTATLRRDGSYRFAKENRWGTFPSASIGWVASEENFAKNIDGLTFLKLRASYGLTGNQRIPPFLYLASIGGGATSDRQYAFGPSSRDQYNTIVSPRVIGKSFTGIPNPQIKWETTKQFNIGFDLTLLNRITVNLDYYSKLTDDLLLYKPLPITTGFAGAFVNLGQVSNKGLELNITSNNLSGELGWTTNFNITFNKNEVKELVNDLPVTSTFTRSEKGNPIGMFYGLVVEGLFQSDAEAASYTYKDGSGTTLRTYPGAAAGDLKWKDLNGDGRITDKDRTFLGNPHPKFFYGFTNTFTYKGLELAVQLYGVHGNEIYNQMGVWVEKMDGHGPYNQTARTLNRWTHTNTKTSMPRAIIQDPNSNARFGTSRWVENGSYLRVKNITLSYKVPSRLVSRLGLSMAQVFCNLNNWFTFTDYYGFDPEIGDVNGETLAAGVDAGNYPGSRSIMVGLNINF